MHVTFNRLLVVPLLLCAIGLGCNKLPGAGGVKYPPSWPIKGLTIPPGAKQILLGKTAPQDRKATEYYVDGFTSNTGTDHEVTDWKIAFSYAGPRSDIEAHISECLKPLGYQLWLSQGQQKGWISTDHSRQVMIHYYDIPSIPGISQAYSGYGLSIAFWAHPRPDITETAPIP